MLSLLKHLIQVEIGKAGIVCEGVGSVQLAENFIFTEIQGVETGGNIQKMFNGTDAGIVS